MLSWWDKISLVRHWQERGLLLLTPWRNLEIKEARLWLGNWWAALHCWCHIQIGWNGLLTWNNRDCCRLSFLVGVLSSGQLKKRLLGEVISIPAIVLNYRWNWLSAEEGRLKGLQSGCCLARWSWFRTRRCHSPDLFLHWVVNDVDVSKVLLRRSELLRLAVIPVRIFFLGVFVCLSKVQEVTDWENAKVACLLDFILCIWIDKTWKDNIPRTCQPAFNIFCFEWGWKLYDGVKIVEKCRTADEVTLRN